MQCRHKWVKEGEGQSKLQSALVEEKSEKRASVAVPKRSSGSAYVALAATRLGATVIAAVDRKATKESRSGSGWR